MHHLFAFALLRAEMLENGAQDRRRSQKFKKILHLVDPCKTTWRAGGKPSIWFPPGRLVEQRSVKEEGIYRKRLEGNGAKKQRKEAADIDKSKIRHHMTN